jgi:hypothetical protein
MINTDRIVEILQARYGWGPDNNGFQTKGVLEVIAAYSETLQEELNNTLLQVEQRHPTELKRVSPKEISEFLSLYGDRMISASRDGIDDTYRIIFPVKYEGPVLDYWRALGGTRFLNLTLIFKES